MLFVRSKIGNKHLESACELGFRGRRQASLVTLLRTREAGLISDADDENRLLLVVCNR